MVKAKSIEKLFLHILTYSYLLLPIFLLVAKYKRKDGILMGLYGIVLFSILFVHIYGFVRASFLYLTVYTFLEYVFFTAILWAEISSRRLKYIMVLLSVVFIVFQAICYLLIYSSNHYKNLDSVPVGIESILIFVYISFIFYENFNSVSENYIYSKPSFWISIGMLVYLGSTFFFNILANHIDETQILKYWFLTYIADITKNILFVVSIIVGIRLTGKEKVLNKSVPYLDLDMN